MENQLKFCQNCGAEIDYKAEICPKCGVRTSENSTDNNSGEEISGLAITALILGILSFPCLCSYICGIPAIIVGSLELSKINKGKSSYKGKWMAWFGIIAGGIFSLLGLIWTVFWGGMFFLSLLGG